MTLPATAVDDFNVPVPTDELDARPVFEPMKNGWYNSTLQSGAQIKDGKKLAPDGSPTWRGIRVSFSGFTARDGKVYERDRNYQVTIHSDNAKALQIGRQQATQLAVAFGLTEDVTDPTTGKPAKRMLAKNPQELVEQLNSVAGSPCDVYVVVRKRKDAQGNVVMRDDNSGPMLDNEITAVAPLGQGK